jgi:membrane protease YdiL (CAAX protease family)
MKMDDTHPLKPMYFGESLLIFGIPAALFVLSVYGLIPALMDAGQSEYVSYSLGLMVPLIVMLAAAFIALRLESRPLTWPSIRERFRLRRMDRSDWLWTVIALPAMVIGMGVMSWVAEVIRQATHMPLPANLIPILDPRLSAQIIEVFRNAIGPRYLGDWGAFWLLFVVLFFNIVGEELWWRGYVLPRQELAFGKWTWLIHGTLWACFHAFKYWEVLSLLPVTLILSYVAQKRRNTWPGIILHYLINGVSFIPVILIITGKI